MSNYESVFDNDSVRVKLADTEDGIALSLDLMEDGEPTAGTTIYIGSEQIDGMCAWLEKYRSARPEALRSGETPRTDAVAQGVAMYSNDDVKLRDALAHGRELERELAEQYGHYDLLVQHNQELSAAHAQELEEFKLNSERAIAALVSVPSPLARRGDET